MRFIYFFFISIIFLSCCDSGYKKKEKSIIIVEKKLLDNNFQVYIPEKNSSGDSIVNSISELKDLKIAIEDLTKVNPNEIETFLDESLIKCNKLLNNKKSNLISRPEVRGRLKVLKTNILKCKFDNHRDDLKNLNKNLKKLFLSYDILFETLEGF